MRLQLLAVLQMVVVEALSLVLRATAALVFDSE